MGWKEAVGKIAPVLGMALTGNLPGAAAAAIGTIADALGLDSKTPEAIEMAVRGMTPEQALLLKKADQDFALSQIKEMNRAAEESERIAANDRDSARKREMAVKDYTPMILAGVVVSGYMLVTFFVMTQVIDNSMRDLALRSLGTLDMALGLTLSYYFGSSSGSRGKDRVIESAVSRNSM